MTLTLISDEEAAQQLSRGVRKRCISRAGGHRDSAYAPPYLGWEWETEIQVELQDGRVLLNTEYFSGEHGRKTGTQALVSWILSTPTSKGEERSIAPEEP